MVEKKLFSIKHRMFRTKFHTSSDNFTLLLQKWKFKWEIFVNRCACACYRQWYTTGETLDMNLIFFVEYIIQYCCPNKSMDSVFTICYQFFKTYRGSYSLTTPKLDGVGLVDNIPSNNYVNQIDYLFFL